MCFQRKHVTDIDKLILWYDANTMFQTLIYLIVHFGLMVQFYGCLCER